MAVYVYADGATVYAPHLPGYSLLDLRVTVCVDKAGTASITMPPSHPSYNSFTSYKTLVTIYRDDILLFRGRALYPEDAFDNTRTITCEGERGFFLDSIIRPYLYQDEPSAIFTDLVEQHNAQVEADKRFQVGTITATDPNDYVRLESSKAEQTSDAIGKLLERVGGYLVFTTNTSGQRVVNWYDELNYRSNQAIEFGSNLLDFSRSGANTDMATVIVPYGAKDEATGIRVTIEEANNGVDHIQDDEAVELRGSIVKAVYWDDVTSPYNLLTKAQQYLAHSKMIVQSLNLSAVDLSVLDKNIDTFQVGDLVQVRSKPHAVDDMFLLRERTYDLLNPANDTVVLGKETATLTGADVMGDKGNMNEIHRTENDIKGEISDVTEIVGGVKDELGDVKDEFEGVKDEFGDVKDEVEGVKGELGGIIETTTRTCTSLINQTSEEIRLEVSETYAKNEDIESMVSTSLTQTAQEFEFKFESLEKTVDENDAEARARYEAIEKYIRFVDGNIVLGEAGNELVLRIENDRISFLDAGAEVAYLSDQKLNVTDGQFIHSLRIGQFIFLPRRNGNLSLVRATPDIVITGISHSPNPASYGNTVTITVTATGQNLGYQWQRKIDTITDGWENISGATTNKYQFQYQQYTQKVTIGSISSTVTLPQYYRCVVSDITGAVVTSDELQL